MKHIRIGHFALAALLSGSLIFFFVELKEIFSDPLSTPIRLVHAPSFEPAAPPTDLAPVSGETMLTLAFAGDIMQHRAQMQDRFADSYAQIAPLLSDADLALGNLEFPVDTTQPLGPPPSSVRFNGSPDHLRALADAGMDVLITANNHSFDQGLNGAIRTVEHVELAGMRAVGTGPTWDRAGTVLLDVRDVRIGIAAYTFRPNSYPDEQGETTYWDRSWPIYELNFADWTDEYREKGLRVFREHVARARHNGAKVLIAFVHWGEEWHFHPTEDQRLAGRDMIDAGFDLVVGSHSHVLNPAEIYKGRLIAYSLGNLISAFKPLEVRTGAVLEVDISFPDDGGPSLRAFRFRPVLTQRPDRAGASVEVVPVSEQGGRDHVRALDLARSILGASAVKVFP